MWLEYKPERKQGPHLCLVFLLDFRIQKWKADQSRALLLRILHTIEIQTEPGTHVGARGDSTASPAAGPVGFYDVFAQLGFWFLYVFSSLQRLDFCGQMSFPQTQLSWTWILPTSPSWEETPWGWIVRHMGLSCSPVPGTGVGLGDADGPSSSLPVWTGDVLKSRCEVRHHQVVIRSPFISNDFCNRCTVLNWNHPWAGKYLTTGLKKKKTQKTTTV